MQKDIKSQITRIITVAIFFGVVLLVLLYALGYYDLTFIDREKLFGGDIPSASTPSESESSTGEDEGDSTGTNVPEDVSPTTNTAFIFDVGEITGSHSAIADMTSSYEIAPGGFIFIPDSSIITKLQLSASVPEVFSSHTRLGETFKIIDPPDDSDKYAVYSETDLDVPAVEVYMGYVMISYGDGYTYIFSPDGTALSKIPVGKYTPAYTRDNAGHALFVRPDDMGRDAYFYISEDGSTFIQSDYVDAADSRGLYFDYPESYGAADPDIGLTRVYDEKSGTFYFVNKWGTRLTNYNFTSAYNFSGNLAAVTTADNRGGMYFLSKHGYRPFVTWRTFLNEHSRYVIENYLPPVTRGIESIGFFYFDEGLTRVRRQVIDYWNWDANGLSRVVSDEDLLIREDGSKYAIPSGYTLEGYSNGVLLLSRDGLYGYMHARGEWIAQPIYRAAAPFMGGLGVLTADDGRVGMIDTDGNVVLPFEYDYISSVSDGVISAYREKDGASTWELYRIASEIDDVSGDLVETIE